jgi:hypothetical protein
VNKRATRIALRAREGRPSQTSVPRPEDPASSFLRAHSRHSWFFFLSLFAIAPAFAQAPLLQDGATSLRQERLDWARGQTPLPPPGLPSFEVGLGGADSDGVYTPMVGGEGFGLGTGGWGLGLQGRYVRGGWSLAATGLALRGQGRTRGILQRAALAYQAESGWRVALEQAPLAWGSGLSGGDLLGDAAHPFPRLSLSTSEATLALGRWQAEVLLGRLEPSSPIPGWLSDREERLTARADGLDLRRPILWGGRIRASFGALVETSLATVTMAGGRDALGQAAPASSARSESLAELRVRLPFLARLIRGQGASLYLNRSGAPDSDALALVPARDLGGLQLVWEGWDLGLEYAAAAQPGQNAFRQPAYLAGFSIYGDPLGSAFGRETTTRTVEVGLPLFPEGQGRCRIVRATAAQDHPGGTGSWLLQVDAQWRTSTGRFGASLASRRSEFPAASLRWGWAGSVFQAFRVF